MKQFYNSFIQLMHLLGFQL